MQKRGFDFQYTWMTFDARSLASFQVIESHWPGQSTSASFFAEISFLAEIYKSPRKYFPYLIKYFPDQSIQKKILFNFEKRSTAIDMATTVAIEHITTVRGPITCYWMSYSLAERQRNMRLE